MPLFQRDNWTLFRSLGTLPQVAGVTAENLPRLVAKELYDNALDAAPNAAAPCIEVADAGALRVCDSGPGLDGTPEEVAALFSIGRPLMSSKQLRLPTRGALGNGLRVVVGYVTATEGTLRIVTRGQDLHLKPGTDGTTAILSAMPAAPSSFGTVVEIHPGAGHAFTARDLSWTHLAAQMPGAPYAGKSSPYWYDEDAFFELCQAYGDRFARDLVAMLDGCANPKAGRIAKDFQGRAGVSLSREDAAALLRAARDEAKPVAPKRLGAVGASLGGDVLGYARDEGTFTPASARGTLRAELPFVVECWATSKDAGNRDTVAFCVNRTPAAATIAVQRQSDKTHIGIFGCGLRHAFKVGRAPVALTVNIQTPFMPITSEGKAPDLAPFTQSLGGIIVKAAASAKNKRPRLPVGMKPRTEAAIIRGVIDEAAARASGNGTNRFSVRQLFYQVRPFVLSELNKELKYENFTRVLEQVEDERGADLPGIYRDARGTLLHPHTGEMISLGTLQVEKYARPAWNFNKVLYIEKEGFFQLLIDARWPERHDCALLTSKGFASRAARDMIDLLGDTAEGLDVFCVHDADASGTLIYQALQDATRARPARRIQIVNLGLEPAEGVGMGLGVERFDRPEKPRTVAGYVDEEWREWLQTARIELNAMPTAQFIEWLDAKFATHQSVKLVPPAPVLVDTLTAAARATLKRTETEKILAEAGLESRVTRAMERHAPALDAARLTLEADTRTRLDARPAQSWGEAVADRAAVALGVAGQGVRIVPHC